MADIETWHHVTDTRSCLCVERAFLKSKGVLVLPGFIEAKPLDKHNHLIVKDTGLGFIHADRSVTPEDTRIPRLEGPLAAAQIDWAPRWK